MSWCWLTVIGLSMTPALIAGKSAALLAGIACELPTWALLSVVAFSSYLGGLLVVWMAGKSAEIARFRRLLSRLHSERAVSWCQKYGPWGGLTLGVAAVGPLPILIALRWMKVEARAIYLPLAVSAVLFTGIYYAIVAFGYHQASQMQGMF